MILRQLNKWQKDDFNESHSNIYRYQNDKYEYREVDGSKLLTRKNYVQRCQRFLKYDWHNAIFTDEAIYLDAQKIQNDEKKRYSPSSLTKKLHFKLNKCVQYKKRKK